MEDGDDCAYIMVSIFHDVGLCSTDLRRLGNCLGLVLNTAHMGSRLRHSGLWLLAEDGDGDSGDGLGGCDGVAMIIDSYRPASSLIPTPWRQRIEANYARTTMRL